MEKTDIQIIKLELLDEPVQSMRTDIPRETIELLAESIRADGLINPITVRKVGDRYEVVAGHRRLLACRIAPLYDVPCVVRELTNEQVFNIMSAENLAREDVNPVDQALHIKRLIGDDKSRIKEVADRLHYSADWVRSRLEILTYPDYFWPSLAQGDVSLSVASFLSEIQSKFWQEQYFVQALRHGMSSLQARYLRDQAAMGLCPEPSAMPPDDGANPGATCRLAHALCAQCGGDAVEPNIDLVYVHKECPSDTASPTVS